MLGCDARCQDVMRDARMRCAMLHSILASHPGIAHRILASRIASQHSTSHPSIAHRVRKRSWTSYALFTFSADIVFVKLNFKNEIVIASVCISFHTRIKSFYRRFNM